jgi:hypothetical protein
MVEGDNRDKDPGIRTSELDAHSSATDSESATRKKEKGKRQARRLKRSKNIWRYVVSHTQIVNQGWRL